MATFVRPWHGRRETAGGLFGSRMRDQSGVLGWSRAQQAAFLIYAWQLLREAVLSSPDDWAKKMVAAHRKLKLEEPEKAPFYSPYSLLVTDQGVRGFLHVLNDLCFFGASRLDLAHLASPSKSCRQRRRRSFCCS